MDIERAKEITGALTVACQRCGATEKMPIILPAKMDYYIAALRVATENFGAQHLNCSEPTAAPSDRP